MPRREQAPSSRFDPATTIALGIVLALLWLALSGGEDWVFGALAIAAVLVVSQGLAPLPAMRISPRGLARFLGFFLRGSMLGGADVARRALSPRLPLEVQRQCYRLAVPPGPPRAVFIGAVSLLPGTLSVRLQGDELLVHSIAGDAGVTLRRLERRVAELFGLPPDRDERGSTGDG